MEDTAPEAAQQTLPLHQSVSGGRPSLPVFLVDLEVVGAVANGRVEGKGLV